MKALEPHRNNLRSAGSPARSHRRLLRDRDQRKLSTKQQREFTREDLDATLT